MVKGNSDFLSLLLVDTKRNLQSVACIAISATLAGFNFRIKDAVSSLRFTFLQSGYTLTSPYRNTYNLNNRSSQRKSLGVIAIEKVQNLMAVPFFYKIAWSQMSLIKSQST